MVKRKITINGAALGTWCWLVPLYRSTVAAGLANQFDGKLILSSALGVESNESIITQYIAYTQRLLWYKKKQNKNKTSQTIIE